MAIIGEKETLYKQGYNWGYFNMSYVGIFNSYNTYCAPRPMLGGCCYRPPMMPIFGGCCRPPVVPMVPMVPMMYGACGINQMALGAGLGYGLGMAFPSIVDGLGTLCSGIWKGVSWLGGKVWDGVSWLGGKIWDGMCWIGRGIKNIFTKN